MFSTMTVINVTSSKNVEPFVIEIEEKTEITNVIRPILKEKLSQEEALTKYFIMKYVTARETYSFSSHDYNYKTVVRLMSSSQAYSNFKSFIKSKDIRNPTNLGKTGKEK